MATEKRPPGNPAWVKGGASPNPGGRPRRLVEIEEMLDDEFRTVESVREAMRVLKKLAVQGATQDVYWHGSVCGEKTLYSEGFMKLYLDRIMGPIREQVSEEELRELSDETLNEIRQKIRLVK